MADELQAVSEALAGDDAEHSRRRRWIMVALGVAALVGMLSSAFLLGRLLVPDPWDPLGDYPTQQADPEVVVTPGVEAFVSVFATKCFGDRPVRTTGELRWQSLNPRGAFVEVVRGGTVDRPAGCHDFDFWNPVPARVAEVTAAAPGREMIWEIAGTEWPVRDDGTLGVRRDWRTAPILVRVLDR